MGVTRDTGSWRGQCHPRPPLWPCPCIQHKPTNTFLSCHNWRDDWLTDWLITQRAAQKTREEKEAKWCKDASISDTQRKLWSNFRGIFWQNPALYCKKSDVSFIHSIRFELVRYFSISWMLQKNEQILQTVCAWREIAAQTETQHGPDMTIISLSAPKQVRFVNYWISLFDIFERAGTNRRVQIKVTLYYFMICINPIL